MATRGSVGLYDVYYQGPIDIKGPDALALLDQVLARDVPRRLATDGQVLYASMCNDAGGMIAGDQGVERRGAEDDLLTVGGPEPRPTPPRVGGLGLGSGSLRDGGLGLRSSLGL